jgi:hypothetical protein
MNVRKACEANVGLRFETAARVARPRGREGDAPDAPVTPKPLEQRIGCALGSSGLQSGMTGGQDQDAHGGG